MQLGGDTPEELRRLTITVEQVEAAVVELLGAR
jgi:hypothetical protein